MSAPLPPVERPNGKLYRPRKLSANAVNDYGDFSGVVVFGTHDPGRAQALANDYAVWQLGAGYVAVDPVRVWWRDGFEGGSRAWVTDEEHGRAGVWFRQIAEVTR